MRTNTFLLLVVAVTGLTTARPCLGGADLFSPFAALRQVQMVLKQADIALDGVEEQIAVELATVEQLERDFVEGRRDPEAILRDCKAALERVSGIETNLTEIGEKLASSRGKLEQIEAEARKSRSKALMHEVAWTFEYLETLEARQTDDTAKVGVVRAAIERLIEEIRRSGG